MATLEDLSNESRDELALLARELSENKETRKDFLKLVKSTRPNLPVPELEMDERLQQTETATTARVQQLEGKLAERDMRDELQRRRQALKDKGIAKSDEDISAIEKVMLDKGIQNHETAADYWKWMSQSAAPTPTGYNRNVLDEGVKGTLSKYWKNPVTAARDEAAKALNELRKNPRPIGY